METVNLDYRGFVLFHLKVPLTTGDFTVEVGSNEPHLAALLTVDDKIVSDPTSFENAIAVAKRRIDRLLGG
jgi:hypothetical protein